MSSRLKPKPPSTRKASRGAPASSRSSTRRSRFSSAVPNAAPEEKYIKIIDEQGADVTPRSLINPQRRKTVLDIKAEAAEDKFQQSAMWTMKGSADSSHPPTSTLPNFSTGKMRSGSVVSSLRSSFASLIDDEPTMEDEASAINDSVNSKNTLDRSGSSYSLDDFDETITAKDMQLSDAELNKLVHIKIEETETMWLFEMDPTWANEAEEEDTTIANNAYEALLQRRTDMPDSFGDRFSQTNVLMSKQKESQTVSTATTSVQTQASQAAIRDVMPVPKGRFAQRASQLMNGGALAKNRIPKQVQVQHHGPVASKAIKHLGFGVVQTEYLCEEEIPIEKQWKEAKQSNALRNQFELMERLLQHEVSAERQCWLWDGVVQVRPPSPAETPRASTILPFVTEAVATEDAAESDALVQDNEGGDSSDSQGGNLVAVENDNEKEGGEKNEGSDGEGEGTGTGDGATKRIRSAVSIATTSASRPHSSINTGHVQEDEEEKREAAEAGGADDFVSEDTADGDESVTNPLEFVLQYQADVVPEGSVVTSFAWNRQFSHILAVGYSIGAAPGHAVPGLVLCWNVKQPQFPQRTYRLPDVPMSVAFSVENPMLMAVGTSSGQLCIFDTQKGGPDPLLDTSANDPREKHSHAIWSVSFVAFESKEVSEAQEALITASVDGVVMKWSFHKGLEPVPLISIKRVIQESGSRSGVGHKKTAFIARQAGVTAISFNPADTSSYLVGTEDGNIHRCATAYTDSYLTTCFAHDGVIQSLAFSPKDPSMFLTCSQDWSLKVWSLKEDSPRHTLLSKQCPVADAAWSNSSSGVIASISDDTLFLWDLQVSTQDPVASCVPNAGTKLTKVSFNTTRHHLVVGSADGRVFVYKIGPLAGTGNKGTGASRKPSVVATASEPDTREGQGDAGEDTTAVDADAAAKRVRASNTDATATTSANNTNSSTLNNLGTDSSSATTDTLSRSNSARNIPSIKVS